MKKKLWTLMTGSTLLLLLLAGCMKNNKEKLDVPIFPKGDLAPKENFTGNVWLTALVSNDSIYNMVTGNVYFEAGARTNWHSHPSGQILLIIDGEGFHQIKGEPRQVLKKGDVVRCPPHAVHWHGASPDKGMSHIYIVPNTENGIVIWMEPVVEEEYNSN